MSANKSVLQQILEAKDRLEKHPGKYIEQAYAEFELAARYARGELEAGTRDDDSKRQG